MYIKKQCTAELNTCGNMASYYINKLKGTVDSFLQLSVPHISPFYQLYLFSSRDSVIIFKLTLCGFHLDLFSTRQWY